MQSVLCSYNHSLLMIALNNYKIRHTKVTSIQVKTHTIPAFVFLGNNSDVTRCYWSTQPINYDDMIFGVSRESLISNIKNVKEHFLEPKLGTGQEYSCRYCFYDFNLLPL